MIPIDKGGGGYTPTGMNRCISGSVPAKFISRVDPQGEATNSCGFAAGCIGLRRAKNALLRMTGLADDGSCFGWRGAFRGLRSRRRSLYFGAVGWLVVSAGASSWQPGESLVTIS